MPDHAERLRAHYFASRISESNFGGNRCGRLALACAHEAREFWADDFTVLEPGALDWQRLVAGRHLTDAYLLTLAVRRQGCFVTLDRNISIAAVLAATGSNLVVIA